MASVFGHTALASAAGIALPSVLRSPMVFIVGILCSILPDADVLSFKLGIRYGALWGHRGMTHSIFFGVLFCLILVILIHGSKTIKEKSILFIYYSFCMVSHGLLDAMTTGGMGIAFFAPFDETRYFLPFRMIKVSPLGASKFFSEWGLRVLQSEFIWIGLPCIIFAALVLVVRKVKTI